MIVTRKDDLRSVLSRMVLIKVSIPKTDKKHLMSGAVQTGEGLLELAGYVYRLHRGLLELYICLAKPLLKLRYSLSLNPDSR